MTNPTIAATGTRAQTASAKARGAEPGDSQSFSAVLALKLGMGLDATVKVAQSEPEQARESPAEPARAQASTDPRGEAGQTETEHSSRESEETSAAEARESGPAEGDDREQSARTNALSEDPQAKAGVETREPRKDDVQDAPEMKAQNPPQAVAAAGTPAATVERGTASNEAEPTVVAVAVDANMAAGSKRTSSEASRQGERPVRGEGATAAGTGRVERATASRKTKTEQAEGDEPVTERTPRARDPLGLIPEVKPERAETSIAGAKGDKQGADAQPVADLGLGKSLQAEPARQRFADAGQEQAARAASAVAPQAVPQPLGAPQPVGAAFSAASTAGRVGAVGAAGGGGVGGAGVNGGGVGGGSNAGAGFGQQFGGLFAGGRGFGAAFGAAVRGKGAVGVSAASGDTKEQIQAQISRGLAAALRQKGGVMSLLLNPEHLGSMKIDLTLEGGRVTATFDAQSEQARQALRDGVDGLKRSIEEAGLTVKSIDVLGTTPATTTGTGSGASDRSTQTGSESGTQQRHPGEQSGRDPREQGAPWAQEQPEAQVSSEASGGGGVWAEDDGSASGLLRLRVDAVV